MRLQLPPQLHQVLTDTAAVLRERPDSVAPALAAGSGALEGAGFAVDYLELRDAAGLSSMSALDRPARLLVAAHLGRTRLIDNIPVMPR